MRLLSQRGPVFLRHLAGQFKGPVSAAEKRIFDTAHLGGAMFLREVDSRLRMMPSFSRTFCGKGIDHIFGYEGLNDYERLHPDFYIQIALDKD